MLDAHAITKALKGDWHGDYGMAPGPGHSARDRSLQIWPGPHGEVKFHSFAGDNWRHIRDELRDSGLLPARRLHTRPSDASGESRRTIPLPSTQNRWSPQAESLWDSCGPLSGTAIDYLAARGCAVPPSEGELRWHPQMWHSPTWTGPALVARITDAITCEPLTLHRTWITATGKAPIANPRRLLKGHMKRGGVIRLWPDEDVTHGLAIAEGIESALTAGRGISPVWAAVDAGGLSTFPVLSGIEALTIIADNDANGTGQAAADGCAKRWMEAGKEVRIWLPPIRGTDVNDWATS